MDDSNAYQVGENIFNVFGPVFLPNMSHSVMYG